MDIYQTVGYCVGLKKSFLGDFFLCIFAACLSILDHYGTKLESGLAVFLERVGKSAWRHYRCIYTIKTKNPKNNKKIKIAAYNTIMLQICSKYATEQVFV